MTGDDALEASLLAIEAAFARRVPATLSIVLDEAAAHLERRAPVCAAELHLASQLAYRRRIDEAREQYDQALRDLSPSA